MSILTEQPSAGVYSFESFPLKISKLPLQLTYPQSFFQFPRKLLFVMFLSSICKLALPFAMQNLYKSMDQSGNYFFVIFFVFIAIVGTSYLLERSAQKIMNHHKLQVKRILCKRVAKSLLSDGDSSGQKSLWTKISSNINIYVNNYYDSYVNLVFELFKAISIVIYLLYKLGVISLIGLVLCGCTVWVTLILTKSIQKATFANVDLRNQKVSILTQYFQRIVDYQMSWLDLFIAQRIKKLQIQYHKNLRKSKMYDSWCVGLWQFTTIGISSVVLCCYYYYDGLEDSTFQPATIVYFFQMLTFPLNAISWNIAGIKNAKQAIFELGKYQRSPVYNLKFKSQPIKQQPLVITEQILIDDGTQSQDDLTKSTQDLPSIQLSLNAYPTSQIKTKRFYGISSNNAKIFKQLAMRLASEYKNIKVGYADQNSWFLPSAIETILMAPKIKNKYLPKLQQASQILYNLEALSIPFQNPVLAYSGGQKMRISLCRALLWGDIIFIDSDLKSLDPVTREKVLTYLRKLTTIGNKTGKRYTLFIKDPDMQLTDYVNQWLIQKTQSHWQAKQNENMHQIEQRQAQKQKYSGLFPSVMKISKSSTNLALNVSADSQKVNINSIKRILNDENNQHENINNQKTNVKTKEEYDLIKQSGRNNVQYLQRQQHQSKQLISELNRRLMKLAERLITVRRESKDVEEEQINSPTRLPKTLNTLNRLNSSIKQQIPKNIWEQKLQINVKTILYYCKSSQHVIFIISFILMKVIGSYFTYYVNVTKPTDTYIHAVTIFQIALAHIISIVFRSYSFASANLKQAKRICIQANEITIFNHITFYGQNQTNATNLDQDSNEGKKQEKQKNSLTQRLVCLTNSDENSVSNQLPFTLNIFFNNLGTVIAAIAMVSFEVPHMLIFTFILYKLIIAIDQQYREFNQKLKLEQKDQQISFMRCVNYLEQGADYIKIFTRQQSFYKQFEKQLNKVIAISNRTLCLGLWVKINYRLIMLLFMVVAITVYWIVNRGYQLLLLSEDQYVIPNVKFVRNNSDNNYAGLAVMIRQIMSLADYVFYFSLSLADSRAHAVSVERIRRYAQDQNTISNSKQRKQNSEIRRLKIIQNFRKHQKIQNGQGPVCPLIEFRKLRFQYPQNPNEEVFQDLNMVVYPGDRLLLRGKSGAGKTTLFKLITGLYPQIYFPLNTFHFISFSSQHPLRLPQSTALQNIDPYNIRHQIPYTVQKTVAESVKPLLKKQKKDIPFSYEDQVLMNNIRAYLYGYNGLAIYDEPKRILNQGTSTYLVVTHHQQFAAKQRYILEGGKLHEQSSTITNNLNNNNSKAAALQNQLRKKSR